MTGSDDKPGGKARPAQGDDGLELELSRLVAPARAPEPDLADLFGDVQARIASERGPAAWLRSRATSLRALIVLVLLATPAVLTALLWARPDRGVYPLGRMVATVLAISALMACGALLALRPLHRPALPVWVATAMTTASWLVLLALYVLPPPQTLDSAAPLQAPSVTAVLAGARPCAVVGLALGSAVFFVLLAFDRGGSRRATLRAAAAGLCANLVLQLHCPNTAPAHLLLGHLAVLLVLLAVAALAQRMARD